MQQPGNPGGTGCALCHACNFAKCLTFFKVKRETEMENPPGKECPLLPSHTFITFLNAHAAENYSWVIKCKLKVLCLCRHTNKIHMQLKQHVWGKWVPSVLSNIQCRKRFPICSQAPRLPSRAVVPFREAHTLSGRPLYNRLWGGQMLPFLLQIKEQRGHW